MEVRENVFIPIINIKNFYVEFSMFWATECEYFGLLNANIYRVIIAGVSNHVILGLVAVL